MWCGGGQRRQRMSKERHYLTWWWVSWKNLDLSGLNFWFQSRCCARTRRGEKSTAAHTLILTSKFYSIYCPETIWEKKKSFKALIKCICCDEKYTLTQTAYFKDNFIQDKELKNKKLELMFNKASHAKYKLQKMTKLLNVWIAYNAYNIKFRKSKLILELKKPFPFQIRIPNWLRMIQTVSNRVQETDTED